MSKIKQSYKGPASKVKIASNYPNRKLKLTTKRNTRIRIKKV